jgi:hypothetical protein
MQDNFYDAKNFTAPLRRSMARIIMTGPEMKMDFWRELK